MNDLINIFYFTHALAIAVIIIRGIWIYLAWNGIFTVPQLKNEIENLQDAQTNIQNYFLETTRSEHDIQIKKIRVNTKNQNYILNFNILKNQW